MLERKKEKEVSKMGEITRRNLVLSFATTAGKKMNLIIKEPAEGLEPVTVSAAMDEIIASGALGSDGTAASKEEAKYVIQEEEEITLA